MAAIDSIRTILNENLGIEPATITEETSFEELDIDSLDMTELVCALEDETGTELAELEGIRTVGELAAKIESL
ncbi:MAG: acyl carrier protein [Coriobacteriales bacterium]